MLARQRYAVGEYESATEQCADCYGFDVPVDVSGLAAGAKLTLKVIVSEDGGATWRSGGAATWVGPVLDEQGRQVTIDTFSTRHGITRNGRREPGFTAPLLKARILVEGRASDVEVREPRIVTEREATTIRTR